METNKITTNKVDNAKKGIGKFGIVVIMILTVLGTLTVQKMLDVAESKAKVEAQMNEKIYDAWVRGYYPNGDEAWAVNRAGGCSRNDINQFIQEAINHDGDYPSCGHYEIDINYNYDK